MKATKILNLYGRLLATLHHEGVIKGETADDIARKYKVTTTK